MRVFVTGGTGFIGSNFIKQALADGIQIRALKRVDSKPCINLIQQPEWVVGDLESFPNNALNGCDALIHFAAHGVMPENATWEDCFRWNVMAALKTWLLAYNHGIKRFVICGSCFEYGTSGERFDQIPIDAPLEPTGPYHASKAAATMAARAFGVDKNAEVIILRPFHVYGEGEAPSRFWPSLRNAAIKGENFPMTSGTQVRDFIHVTEVAKAFSEALFSSDILAGIPLIKNLGTGKPSSVVEFAKQQWELFGAKGNLQPGAIPTRPNEVMRYVPQVKSTSHVS